MRNKSKIINKAVLAVACTVAVCAVLLSFVDDGLNGAVADWFYNNFMNTYDMSYGEMEGYHTVTEPDWANLKNFVIVFFVISSAAIALMAVLISARSARKKEIATISYISEAMRVYLKQEDAGLELPKEYAEIESQLIQAKNREQEHLTLLEKESQQKNDLITYLAHDLKTPLASVIGYLSLLDEVRDMPVEQREKYAGVALDKAYRLEELIDEFFDITRFNLHSIELSMGRVDLYFLLQQLAEQFYPILSQQNKEVEIHSPEDTMVWADGDKLARAFNNILKNAIAYSYENTVIRIFVEIENRTVVVRFVNKGNPIPPHKLETIFEKFYRLDTSRSTNMGGAGLGLAIAKQIITAHRGEILASSNKESTVFTVVLPEALIQEEH
ncbi:sensor histidine kinase [Murimonas intestini]|uniref:sensor histidine kinase n=1 Tax=Murimonas intestini TaxID=1337051 RepID=UPI001FAB01CA|nr:HAMP domain-containing sensor histidine kinase [Murimonas intestini]